MLQNKWAIRIFYSSIGKLQLRYDGIQRLRFSREAKSKEDNFISLDIETAL
jgi:hypothetical protein